jgi:hypothetical protein
LLLDFPQLGHWALSLLPHQPRARLTTVVEAWRARLRPRAATLPVSPPPTRISVLPLITGSLVIVGQLIAGFGQINSWPVSVHPTFSDRQNAPVIRTSKVTLMLEAKSGEARELSPALRAIGGPRLRVMLSRLAAVKGNRAAVKRYSVVLAALLRESGIDPKPDDQIAIHRAYWDILPLNAHANYRHELIARFNIDSAGRLSLARAGRQAQPAEPAPLESM